MTEIDLEDLVADWLQVAALAGLPLGPGDVDVEVLPAPHRRPTTLRPGAQVVYAFCTADACLKVGKAGPNSSARFTSQHYNPKSANSNLAKSLLASSPHSLAIDGADVGSWIEENTTRYHIYLAATIPDEVLRLLEVFLHCRLHPIFEGREQ